jgi:predicted lysophospholipase L1 biosynthesis ABC-type transport system permease subunit
MESMMARIRFALRSLAKAPLLSLVVVLSLVLGIGANTAIFSLFHQVILSSLPVPHPEELVLAKAPAEFKGGRNSTDDSGGPDSIFSYPMFRELEKRPAGVMVHSVTRRTREIGIRMALGAAPRSIRSMVMREMLWILGIGLVTGIPAALGLAKFTQSQLYGVKAYDVAVVAVAALALAATAVVAGYLPARRASRVNPLDALRYE